MASLQSSDLFNVRNLVAVITGGSSGIGAMMAKTLALNGAKKVYIVGRRKSMLEDTAKESPHGNIIPLVGDVTRKEDLKSIAAHIENDVGYINVLIANSGIAGPQSLGVTPETSLKDFQAKLWEQENGAYNETFTVNVSAVFFTVVAFLGLLDEGNKKGNVEQKSQVIATSSIAGFNRNVPGGFAYGQSKAAVTLLMKQLATQLVPYDIRANIIAPGRKFFAHSCSLTRLANLCCKEVYADLTTVYPSEMSGGLIGDGVFPKSKIPLQRTGTAEDMAGCILFLTSRAGAYSNGNVMVTDGGRLSQMPSTY